MEICFMDLRRLKGEAELLDLLTGYPPTELIDDLVDNLIFLAILMISCLKINNIQCEQILNN